MADGQTLGEANSPAARASFVDSHCHIDMPQFDGDREAVVARARAAGVETMLLVGGVDEESGPPAGAARGGGARAARPPPASIPTRRGSARATLRRAARLARDGRIVAIGEIGLDFHYDHSPRDVQREAFRRQVRLAREVGLPRHHPYPRGRRRDGGACWRRKARGETGGVIHCFTGGHELARRALALGFYISFSGILAFPRAEVIQEVARTVPLDRLLVETDAPFLAPPPHRGKRNEPAFVVEVARKVAALRGESPERRCGARELRRLFGADNFRARCSVAPERLTTPRRIRQLSGPSFGAHERRTMAESSFDVVSSVDLQEVKNAIAQAMKEITTRFDLKGTSSDIVARRARRSSSPPPTSPR